MQIKYKNPFESICGFIIMLRPLGLQFMAFNNGRHLCMQRITEDVQKFASAISELFSYTFKPILDIVLFTRSLAKTIG